MQKQINARGFLKPFKRKTINRMRLLHNFPRSYAFFNIRLWRLLFRAQGQSVPKRKSLAYYSQLPKRRFSGVDSMHSHVDSPRVSLDRALDAFAHVDSLRVSVDATSRKEAESSGCNSSGTYSNPFRICLHQFSIDSVTRYNESVIQPALPPRNSDKGSEPVSQQESRNGYPSKTAYRYPSKTAYRYPS